MSLPNDKHRCAGVGDDVEGWREGCELCLRRTSTADDQASWIEPPRIIAFECELFCGAAKTPRKRSCSTPGYP